MNEKFNLEFKNKIKRRKTEKEKKKEKEAFVKFKLRHELPISKWLLGQLSFR